jgi:hypothetical protein
MRYRTPLVGLVCAVAVATAVALNSSDDPSLASANPGTRTSLADVAAACNDGDPSVPGVIEVAGELRDSNTTVELDDCIIRLVDGADVTLNNVTVSGGILNVHDRDTPTSSNRIKLQRTTFDMTAVLVELNDADDEFRAEQLDATVAVGFSVKVAETEGGANDGGSIRMVGSSVLATEPGAPLTVAASEHSGTVELVNTSLDTLGLLTVVAGDCSGRMGGEAIDCSPDALADDLEAP